MACRVLPKISELALCESLTREDEYALSLGTYIGELELGLARRNTQRQSPWIV